MRQRLLLADDSVTIQRVIELTFADEHIEVIAVGDGEAAIARLDADPPDIVLADVGMPGRDGYDVALHVSRTPPLAHIPVVLLIGALQPLDDRRAKEAGCAGVLVKPFEPNQVIAKVRELLARAGAGARTPPSARDEASPAPESAGVPSTGGAPNAQADTVSPADAVLAAPPSSDAASGTVDDYFARLDAAFASFDTEEQWSSRQTEVPKPAVTSPAPDGLAPAAAGERKEPAPQAALAGKEAADEDALRDGIARSDRPHTLADAFAVLLALEQGQSSPRLPEDWPSSLVEVVEEVAQRVVEQVAERVVCDLAPDIVSQISERLVREEIDRLRREMGPA